MDVRRGRRGRSATAAGLLALGIAVAACGQAGTTSHPLSGPASGPTSSAASGPTSGPASGPTTPGPAPSGSAAPVEGLGVRGMIEADGTASFEPALPLDRAPTPDDPAATHAIVLLGSAGTVVHSTRFTPDVSAPEPARGATAGAPASSFFVVVPGDLSSVTEVRLEAAGTVMATQHVSASAPTVSSVVVSDGDADELGVAWASSDPDQDPLTHTVLVSADGGASWQVVAIDVTDTSVSLPRWSLPGGRDSLLRVVVSDGLRTAVATSPATLANNPPTVEISSPADGQVAAGHQTVILRATVADPEDGSTHGTPVEWSSDLDGVLGTAPELLRRADELSVGTHVLTATARDSAGGVGSDRVTLQVRR